MEGLSASIRKPAQVSGVRFKESCSFMVRVPHYDPEPALREPQGLELVEMVHGSEDHA